MKESLMYDPPETDDNPEPEPFPEQPVETPQEDFDWGWTEGMGNEWDSF